MPTADPQDWSFFEHLTFVLGRWPLILGASVLLGGAGFLAGALLTARVGGEGLLRIGSAYHFGRLEKPADVAGRMSSRAFLGSLVSAHPKQFPAGLAGLRLSASVSEASNLVVITSQAPSAEQAEAVVRLAAQRIAAEDDKVYDRVESIVRAQIERITRQQATLEKQAAALRETRGVDATTRAFITTRQQDLLDEENRLSAQAYSYRLDSDPAVNPRTALVDGPTTHPESHARKAAGLGGVSGAVLGIFLAYFFAFLRRRRQEAGRAAPVASVSGDRGAGNR